MTIAAGLYAASGVSALNPLSPSSILHSAGMWALWIVIFAETGLLVGFFLPGDTVLFLAGIASSSIAGDLGFHLPIVPLVIVTPIAAILGAQAGYLLGARYGIKIFDRPESRLFKREYVDKTEAVFNRFGAAKAVVLGRFIPIFRTFLNPAAAVLEMPARRFLLWNIVGGIVWTDTILLLGHFLAKQITNIVPADKIDNYLVPIILLIVVISATPMLIDALRKRSKKNRYAPEHRAGSAPRNEVGAGRPGPDA